MLQTSGMEKKNDLIILMSHFGQPPAKNINLDKNNDIILISRECQI